MTKAVTYYRATGGEFEEEEVEYVIDIKEQANRLIIHIHP